MPPKKATPAPAKKKSTAVAVRGNTEVSTNVLAAMAQDAGKGLENMSAADVSMPFLTIIQSGSPQLKTKNEKYVKGAEEGNILETSTNTPMDSTRVIICSYEKCFIEWVPREKGGGFVRKHDRNTDEMNNTKKGPKGENILPNGNHLVETAIFYVLFENPEGDWKRAVLSMKSTQLKKARKICTTMSNQIVEVNGSKVLIPSYGSIFALRGDAEEDNDQGSWRGWAVELDGRVTDLNVYNEAKAFSAIVMNEGVAVNHNNADDIEV